MGWEKRAFGDAPIGDGPAESEVETYTESDHLHIDYAEPPEYQGSAMHDVILTVNGQDVALVSLTDEQAAALGIQVDQDTFELIQSAKDAVDFKSCVKVAVGAALTEENCDRIIAKVVTMLPRPMRYIAAAGLDAATPGALRAGLELIL